MTADAAVQGELQGKVEWAVVKVGIARQHRQHWGLSEHLIGRGDARTGVHVAVDEANQGKDDEGRHAEGDVDVLVRVALHRAPVQFAVVDGASIGLAAVGGIVKAMGRTADALVRHLVEGVLAREKLTAGAAFRAQVAGTELIVQLTVDWTLTGLAVARLLVAALIGGVPLVADHAVAVRQTAEDIGADAVLVEGALRVLQPAHTSALLFGVSMARLAATGKGVIASAHRLTEAARLALRTEGAVFAHCLVPGDAHSVGNVDGRRRLTDALVIAAVGLTQLTAAAGNTRKVTFDVQQTTFAVGMFCLARSNGDAQRDDHESKNNLRRSCAFREMANGQLANNYHHGQLIEGSFFRWQVVT